jgi:hypothetical protein
MDALARVPCFAKADPTRLAELVPHTDRMHLLPGRTVVEGGTAAREVVVVLAGEAAALDPDGGWTVLRAGAQLGVDELLGQGNHPATVVATFGLEVVVIAGPAFRWAHREGLVDAGRSRVAATAAKAEPSTSRPPVPTPAAALSPIPTA